MYDMTWVDGELDRLKSKKLSDFSTQLTPGCKPVLGVKLPDLRKIAKTIAKGDYRTFLAECPDTLHEYLMLQAFVIGYAKADIDVALVLADAFVPKINDWAVNDGFCQNFKIAEKHREKVWEWLAPYAAECSEFSQRMTAVMLLSHFLVEEYLDRVLQRMNDLQYDGYYTKMAVAWCVATAYAKFPERTLLFMRDNRLDDWTFNKAVQKCIESYRVSDADKKLLRSMKR